jgi:hypothetical protein
MSLRRLVQLVLIEKPAFSGANKGRLVNIATIDDTKKGEPRREYFMPRETVIFGKDEKVFSSAEWTFDIEYLLRYCNDPKGTTLEKVFLHIRTVRTHGGLHVKPDIGQQAINAGTPKAGRVYVNGTLIDRINLMKPMPHGLNYGFNRLEPWDITDFVRLYEAKKNKAITIKVETDPEVKWDISSVSLEPWVGVPISI